MDIASVVIILLILVAAGLLCAKERKERTAALDKASTAELNLAKATADLDALRNSLQEKINLATALATEKANEELAEERRKYIQLSNEKMQVERNAQETAKHFEFIVRQKDDEIDRIKNDKAKLSVKLLGESLEQHCEIAFNQVRSYAFPNATFKKDNDASQGSKGDYIYQEHDENGIEMLSIMFEMKNEAESSTNTKRNSDYFKKLDKDRKNKNCEYAVLVSLLEQGNDLYDAGIADVSYEYEKMFVIRPQFFIPFIGLLRNAALSSLKAKQELERKRQEDVDLTNFEDKLESLKGDAAKCYETVQGKSASATKAIELAISKLKTAQTDIEAIDKSSMKARSKTEDFTIRKLTWKNPGMKAKLEAAEPKAIPLAVRPNRKPEAAKAPETETGRGGGGLFLDE